MGLMTKLARRVLLTAITGASSLVGMGVGSVLAQTQPVQPTLAAKGSQAANVAAADTWLKICAKDPASKKDFCRTAYELIAATGQPLASYSVNEPVGETRKFIEITVPNGMLLQPGLKIQVDDQKAEDAKYGYCSPVNCVASFVTNDAGIAAMKKGKMLVVTTQGQAANALVFNFPLATFKSVNEGKPLDQDTFKKRMQAIQDEIRGNQTSFDDQMKAAQKKALEQGQ